MGSVYLVVVGCEGLVVDDVVFAFSLGAAEGVEIVGVYYEGGVFI